MKVAIIGCGLIGKRRAHVVHELPSDELVIVADINESCAIDLAKAMSCLATTDWREVVSRDDLDVIIVSTTNNFLMPVTVASLERGKNVLCEKPLGRNSGEAEKMVNVAWHAGVFLKTGFNHRHHSAIWKAYELCNQGAIGQVMFIRAVYGHGGRPGYDKEWRADPDLAGGGELLDQGVHILDLCCWFMGDFTEVFGFTSTYYWNLGYFQSSKNHQSSANSYQLSAPSRQLEDNAFVLLRTADGRIAQFHTSWTQWKNRFTFEIFGEVGYLIIDGLGGNYGVETLRIGKRKLLNLKEDKQYPPNQPIVNQLKINNVVPQYAGGPPDEEIIEFPGPDLSWQKEWQEFASAIQERRQPLANGEEGLRVMRMIDAIYESCKSGHVVYLDSFEKELVNSRVCQKS